MTMKLSAGSSFDAKINESNTANRNYYLPDNDSGIGTKLMTAQASTSGTSIDFTGIPSWAKRITVMFNGVGTSGSSSVLMQLGTSGGIQNTGYVASGGFAQNAAGTIVAQYSTGFGDATASAANTRYGVFVFTLLDPTIGLWVAAGTFGFGNVANIGNLGGSKTLSGTLDRIRITTVNGTDTFDAGTINVMYE